MTATAPAAPQPTPEQLQAYADQLPDLYKYVLAALQFAQPNRVVGQGVLAGTVRMFLHNRRYALVGDTPAREFADPRFSGQEFLDAVPFLSEEDFAGIADRLYEAGFLELDDEPKFPRLTPTPLGERLIAALTGKETPHRPIPQLPNPTW